MEITGKLIALSAIGLLLMGAVTACGKGHFRLSPEKRAQYFVEHVTEELKLTEPQVAKLNGVKDELLAARRHMVAQRQSAQETVLEMLEQPTMNRERVLSLVQQRTQEVNDKAPQIVAALGDFYDALSPEQRQKLRDEVKEHMEHRRHRWSH